ncbi:MAG: hypothetical protein ACRD3T_17980, partial [Terriglobia bacterium]
AGERPEVSRLARYQARTQRRVTTLLHAHVDITDDMGWWMFQLLDGSRDRSVLLDEITARAPEGDRKTLAGQIDRSLAALARLGLLRDTRKTENGAA